MVAEKRTLWGTRERKGVAMVGQPRERATERTMEQSEREMRSLAYGRPP